MKRNVFENTRKFVLGLAMLLVFTSAALAQSVNSFNITEKMVTEAQQAWCDALVKISETHAAGGDYKTVASEIIDAAYYYQKGIVLFKPTLASGEQTFRLDKEGALAYFVGGNPIYRDDAGFALRGWTKATFKNKGVILNGDTAITMGNVYLTDKTGSVTMVDKTWAFKLDDNGKLRIILHHSSLPYKPSK